MNGKEQSNLAHALYAWRSRSQAMRWKWYKSKSLTDTACDDFYDNLLAAHESLVRYLGRRL